MHPVSALVPPRYGGMCSQMKAFWDATGGLWVKGALVGKPFGMFVSTGTQGGGQETTPFTGAGGARPVPPSVAGCMRTVPGTASCLSNEKGGCEVRLWAQLWETLSTTA